MVLSRTTRSRCARSGCTERATCAWRTSRIRCPPRARRSIRVGAVGICGSDIHWFAEGGIGDARVARSRWCRATSCGGTIAAGGRRGERVAVDPHIPCDRCRYCLAGWPNLCPTGRFSGHGTLDGPLRELVAWPSHLLYPVPDAIPDDQVPLLEPLLIAMHADYLHPVRRGDAVAVVGCGPLGLMQVQVACMSRTQPTAGDRPDRAPAEGRPGDAGASEALDLAAPAGPAEAREAPFDSMDVVFRSLRNSRRRGCGGRACPARRDRRAAGHPAARTRRGSWRPWRGARA